eukprot:324464_1
MLVAFYCLLISQVLEAIPANCPQMHQSVRLTGADCVVGEPAQLNLGGPTTRYDLQCCAAEIKQCPYFDVGNGKTELGWNGPEWVQQRTMCKSGCSKGLCKYPGLALNYNPCPLEVNGYDPESGAHQVDFDDDLFYEEAVLNLQIAEEGMEFARALKGKKRAEELRKRSQGSEARFRRYHRTKPRYYN